jgi:hypothetical protein
VGPNDRGAGMIDVGRGGAPPSATRRRPLTGVVISFSAASPGAVGALRNRPHAHHPARRGRRVAGLTCVDAAT